MVVLNRADGMAEMLTKALAMGGTGLGLARQLLGQMSRPAVDPAPSTSNGTAPEVHKPRPVPAGEG